MVALPRYFGIVLLKKPNQAKLIAEFYNASAIETLLGNVNHIYHFIYLFIYLFISGVSLFEELKHLIPSSLSHEIESF